MRDKNLIHVSSVFFLAAFAFLPAFAGNKNGQEQVEVKLDKIGQKNCSGQNTSEASVVRLSLRLEVVNLTDTKLIVSKGIGAAWYGVIIAKDQKALADGNYELNMNIDWAPTGSTLKSPPSEAPPTDEFTVLGPAKSLIVETTVYLPLQRELQSGEHALQLDLGTWFHVVPAEQFRESWKKYGELLYLPTKSDAVSFRVPPATEFTKCEP